MKSSIILFAAMVLIACNVHPYRATNKAHQQQVKSFIKQIKAHPTATDSGFLLAPTWVGTTNFSIRKPSYVIIHHTAQNSCEETLKTFTTKRTQVSAHYVICKDGTIHHMLNDYLRAHHAGVSRWGNHTDINSQSIGIEIDNNGFEHFTEAQINSLLQLLTQLKQKYAIPEANFIGHGDIAPTRKNDPNWRFPWKTLSDQGFGYWWSDTTNVQVPPQFDHLQALRIIGYEMRDTTAAKLAFKRHFLQDTTKTFGTTEKKVLYQLYKKYF